MIRAELRVRLTLAEAAQQDGLPAERVDELARQQLNDIQDAVNDVELEKERD